MVYESLCYSGINWNADSFLLDIGRVMTEEEEEIEEKCRKIIEKQLKLEARVLKTELFITKHAKTIVIAGWVMVIFIFILFTLETGGFFR